MTAEGAGRIEFAETSLAFSRPPRASLGHGAHQPCQQQRRQCGRSVKLEFKLAVIPAARACAALQRNDLPILELKDAFHVAVENFPV